jgi:acetylornithine deacetylase/succinyl-diaminopimelate desuccinylase-like protein
VAHREDEFVDKKQLEDAVELYSALAERLVDRR